MREIELLTRVAKQHRTFVSNLTQQPDLKWTALGDLYRMEDKTRFSLKDWEEAVSYLLGCAVHFQLRRNRKKPQAFFPAGEVSR